MTYQQSALPGWSDAFCGEPTGNGHVAIELNSAMMIIDAVRAGLGIGELPVHMAARHPELVRIWPQRAGSYDLWLVMHGDLNRTARVRAWPMPSSRCSSRNKTGPRAGLLAAACGRAQAALRLTLPSCPMIPSTGVARVRTLASVRR